MHTVIRVLGRRLKAQLIRRYLIRRRIIFDSPPVFAGRWPYMENEGRMSIGAECFFKSFRERSTITVWRGAVLEIGHHTGFGGVDLCATKSIIVGCSVKIGGGVTIYDSDFHEATYGAPIRQAPVVIGNNVWIGQNAIILAGSRIGDHTVIGAGSVVTGQIPAKSLAVGVPARVVKTYDVPDDWVRK